MQISPRAYLRFAGLSLVALLAACGGGGGGGSSVSAESGLSPSNAAVSVPSRSKTVTTHHDTALSAQVSIGFSVANSPRDGFYIAVDSPSTLVADVQFENTSDTAGEIAVTLVPGQTAGAGLHPVRLDLGFCVDEACTRHLPGSPLSVQIDYDVRAEDRKVQIALTPPAAARALIGDAAGPVANTAIQVLNPPQEGLRFEVHGGSSLVTSSRVVAAGEAYEGRFQLATPASVGLGEHTVSPYIAVCFGEDCSRSLDIGILRFDLNYTVTAAPIQDMRSLDLRLTDLVWDPVYNVIVMAVNDPGRSGNANRGFLDPRTGAVYFDSSWGSTLAQLALSPDGQWIYASQRGGIMLDRYRRDDLSLVDQTYLRSDPDDLSSDLIYVQDLRFGPDGTLAVLASREASIHSPVNSTELRLLDGLTPRPARLVAGTELFARAFCSVSWNEDGGEILVSPTTAEMLRMTVDTTGVSAPVETIAAASCLKGMQRVQGRLVARDGRVIDPATGASAGRVGVERNMTGAVQDVVVDHEQGRVYVLHTLSTDETGDSRITTYDAGTLARRESIVLRAAGLPNRMIRWGSEGLALTNPLGKILLLDGGIAAAD